MECRASFGVAKLDNGAAHLLEDEGGDGAGECTAVFVVAVLSAEEDGGRVEMDGGVRNEGEMAAVEQGEGGNVEEESIGRDGGRGGVEGDEGLEVAEGSGRVEVHFCGDADEVLREGRRAGAFGHVCQ